MFNFQESQYLPHILFSFYKLQWFELFLTLSLPSKLSDKVRFYFMAPHLDARTQNKNYGKTGNAF